MASSESHSGGTSMSSGIATMPGMSCRKQGDLDAIGKVGAGNRH